MKILNKRVGVAFIVIFIYLILSGQDVASAASTTYTQLENIPGFEGNKEFPDYVKSIYSLGIWLVGLSAMFMITIGGFMYMTSAGNTSSAKSAKDVLKDAIIGLLLALATWLILNTINPDLVKMDFESLSNLNPNTAAPAATKSSLTAKTGDSWPDDSAVRNDLAASGISINASNCKTVGQTGCTSVYDLGSSAVSGLKNLKDKYGSSLTVTGGTEYWLHSSHGTGLSVVDVRQDSSLGDYIYSNMSNLSSLGITKICATAAWQKISYNCGSYVEQVDHFHLVF